MIAKSKQGLLMARPAFGYDVKKGQLIVNPETSENVREIFKLFLEGTSLNQIALKHDISLNGIKKILKNFTYIGKIKFNNQVLAGSHKPIISPEIFNQAQQRFEEIEKKRAAEAS
jgi:site-specific DNA recombinase